ncbi:MAG TPA: hemin uptake protein HemP [Usitatibacter sp.]|nr:hemin uptake protein HemP [Usitatibacter sp.]
MASPLSTPSLPIPEALPAQPQAEAQPIDSATLFRGRVEILILHNGREYRLRNTRQGKLILTA